MPFEEDAVCRASMLGKMHFISRLNGLRFLSIEGFSFSQPFAVGGALSETLCNNNSALIFKIVSCSPFPGPIPGLPAMHAAPPTRFWLSFPKLL
jgi:hypothetical protein